MIQVCRDPQTLAGTMGPRCDEQVSGCVALLVRMGLTFGPQVVDSTSIADDVVEDLVDSSIRSIKVMVTFCHVGFPTFS